MRLEFEILHSLTLELCLNYSHIFSCHRRQHTHHRLCDTIRTSQSCLQQAGPDEAPKKVSKKFSLLILIHMFVNSATSKIPPTCHRLLTALMFENIQWMFNGKPPVSYWLIFYASLLTISPLCIFFTHKRCLHIACKFAVCRWNCL